MVFYRWRQSATRLRSLLLQLRLTQLLYPRCRDSGRVFTRPLFCLQQSQYKEKHARLGRKLLFYDSLIILDRPQSLAITLNRHIYRNINVTRLGQIWLTSVAVQLVLISSFIKHVR